MDIENMVPDEPEDVLRHRQMNTDHIITVIEQGELVAKQLQQQLFTAIAQPLMEAEDYIGQQHTLCEGEICSHLANAENSVLKFQGKLAKEAWTYLSEAYTWLSTLGYAYPTQEEVIYGLTTGDYLGTQQQEAAANLGTVDGGTTTVPAVGEFPSTDGPTTQGTTGTGNGYYLGPTGATGSVGPSRDALAGAFAATLTQGASGNDYLTVGGDSINPHTGGVKPLGNNTDVIKWSVGNTPTTPGTNNDLVLETGGEGNSTIPTTNTSTNTASGHLYLPLINWDGTCGNATGPFLDPNLLDRGPFGANPVRPMWPCVPSTIAFAGTPPAGTPFDAFWTVQCYDWNGNVYDVSMYKVAGYTPFAFLHKATGRYSWALYDVNTCQILKDGGCPPPVEPPPPPVVVVDPPPPVDINPQPPNTTGDPFLDVDCAGIVPIMPRFDDGVECLRSDWDARTLSDRFGKLMDELKPTKTGPITRPGNFILGFLWDLLNMLTLGMLAITGSLPWAISRWFGRMLRRIFCYSGCNYEKIRIVGVGAWVFGVINRMSGGTLNFIARPWQHWLNKQCPYELPSVAEANAAWMSKSIDQVTWECWVQAQGARLKPQEKMVDAARARPNINEVTMLYLRKAITEEQWKEAMRGLGVMKDEDRDRYLKLVQAFPGVEDIIRFLVRDVGDAELVKKFSMDADFKKKWQGKIIEYAKAQGISDELAEQYWMAHWYLPSPTQLYEMYHRFADDRRDVPEELKISKETIREALQQQDILPYWIDRLVKISDHPLTRVDAQRAYKIGAITEEDLYYAYRDLGYDDKRASTLVKFVNELIGQAAAKLPGLPTIKTYIDAYVKGEITADELGRKLLGFKKKPEEVAIITLKATEMKELTQRRGRIKATKKLYDHGMIDEQDAVAKLTEAGVDANAAQDLVTEWEEYRTTKQRMPSVSNLCTWASNGWIDAGTHRKALERLGYSEEHAAMLAGECNQKAQLKLAKEAERVQKAQKTAEEKAARKAEQQAAKLLKELRAAIDVYFDGAEVGAKLLDKVDKWMETNNPPPSVPA